MLWEERRADHKYSMVWFDIIVGAILVVLVVFAALRPFRRWVQGRIDRPRSPKNASVVLLPPPGRKHEGDR